MVAEEQRARGVVSILHRRQSHQRSPRRTPQVKEATTSSCFGSIIRAHSLRCGAINRMFHGFAKRILFALGWALVTVGAVNAAESHSAKGGALTVRTNDGRKHFTLTADATWQLDVKERFDASALAFHNSKLITVNDRDGSFYELALHTNSMAKLQLLDLFPKARLTQLAPRKT